MERALAERLEKLVDGVASVSLGGAVGLFVYHLPVPIVFQAAIAAYAAAAALTAYWTSRWLLGVVGRRVTQVPGATVALCDALTVKFPVSVAQFDLEPALVTESVSESGTVVPLFEQAAVAACGQSTANIPASIDRVPNDLSPAVSADASETLHQALDQLRRSLR